VNYTIAEKYNQIKAVQPLRWYAVYTRSRYEKRVVEEMCENGLEAWLPLQKTFRQWKDRKKWVEVPLFNSYVFLHTKECLLKKVVSEATGAVCAVSFLGYPAIVQDEQIENLKLLLDSSEKFEVSLDEFSYGNPIEVYRGPLRGMRGTFVNYKGKKRVMMQIDAINQFLYVDINPACLRKQAVFDEVLV
jgi:transcription antitermination factor NusG